MQLIFLFDHKEGFSFFEIPRVYKKNPSSLQGCSEHYSVKEMVVQGSVARTLSLLSFPRSQATSFYLFRNMYQAAFKHFCGLFLAAQRLTI